MEPQKFVVRLLDATGELLAWTTVWGAAHPQGRPRSCAFRPIGPTLFPIERAGEATDISIHWCDLDLARKTTPIEATAVEPGQVVAYHWIEPLWLVGGSSDVPLPAVTVREDIIVAVPTGLMGIAAGR